MEGYILLIGAVMCVIMALGVIFDSKCWDSNERGGLFNFKHRWVGFICFPMLFIVPILALIFAFILPMNVNLLIECACRLAIFIALMLCAVFITVTVVSVALFFKGMMQADRS